jgi:hypothetical protein
VNNDGEDLSNYQACGYFRQIGKAALGSSLISITIKKRLKEKIEKCILQMIGVISQNPRKTIEIYTKTIALNPKKYKLHSII